MANQSILAAFERMWQHIIVALGNKADVSDVTNLQDTKQNTVTGGATTITSSNLTTNRALISNSSGKVAVSAVTSTELGYLDGVTSDIQAQLDGKAASSHGNHVPEVQTANKATFLRNDNTWQKVTPVNIGAVATGTYDVHVADTTIHMTTIKNSKLDAAYTHSQAAHAPSDAQANQNAFSNIAVSGQTTVAADTTTDTVTFVGSNVSITTDAANDKVTFSVANGTTSAKGLVQLTNSTSSTSTTTAATPNSVKSAYDLANTAKTNAANAQATADEKCIVQMITWEADD